ncbi:FAD-dependent oxidoreductase [Roseovarius sp. S4756]|uniref:FAD-dependent oxidoreductase n=1 Tax=Roseovarius maritimus TaxID=3342637 RepID=UPI003726DB42
MRGSNWNSGEITKKSSDRTHHPGNITPLEARPALAQNGQPDYQSQTNGLYVSTITDRGQKMEREKRADVVIIGGGIAGLSAATAAAWSGKSVLLIEKSPLLGGTARYANGSIWVPNNHLANKKGIFHSPENELDFLLSECWPNYQHSLDLRGVDPNEFHRTKTYIDQASKVIRDLDTSGVLKFTQLEKIFRAFFFSKADSETAVTRALADLDFELTPREISSAAVASWDYKWNNPYNITPYGKHIWANFDLRVTAKYFGRSIRQHWRNIFNQFFSIRSFSSLVDQLVKLPTKFWGMGHGLTLSEKLHRHLKKTDVEILLEHDCVGIEVQGKTVVAVLLNEVGSSETIRCAVGQAAIFGTGCFTQRLICGEHPSKLPIKSTCVAETSDGSALKLFDDLDVKIETTPKPLLSQTVFQLAQKGSGVSHEPVFFLYGDSFFVVDRCGKRLMNEKLNYHERASYHLEDPDKEFLFLVCDKRFVERAWGFGISLPFDQSLLLESDNFFDLRDKVDKVFEREAVEFRLSDEFPDNLLHTLHRFNQYASQGHDPEYGRGSNAYDVLGFPKPDRDHKSPSRSMEPLRGDKFYLCIYSLSAFSTHGGLACDQHSRVLRKNDVPWENLYSVGSSSASFLNGHYPAHGLSIGSSLVFGYLAGLHATNNLPKLDNTEK